MPRSGIPLNELLEPRARCDTNLATALTVQVISISISANRHAAALALDGVVACELIVSRNMGGLRRTAVVRCLSTRNQENLASAGALEIVHVLPAPVALGRVGADCPTVRTMSWDDSKHLVSGSNA